MLYNRIAHKSRSDAFQPDFYRQETANDPDRAYWSTAIERGRRQPRTRSALLIAALLLAPAALMEELPVQTKDAIIKEAAAEIWEASDGGMPSRRGIASP